MNTETNKEGDITRMEEKECLIPGQDDWVYDYFNQALNERGEREFQAHLLECDRCREILVMLDWAYTELRRDDAYKYEGSETVKAEEGRANARTKLDGL